MQWKKLWFWIGWDLPKCSNKWYEIESWIIDNIHKLHKLTSETCGAGRLYVGEVEKETLIYYLNTPTILVHV